MPFRALPISVSIQKGLGLRAFALGAGRCLYCRAAQQ